jgi:hemerythrin superfamily protein
MPDAIVLLKNDHKTVERLFKQYEKLGDGAKRTKRKVVDQILDELALHATIEEKHFYPEIRRRVEDIDDVVLEGYEEHHVLEMTMAELRVLDPEAENFDAKVTVLIEMVRHHVEEEEQEMFPKVREAMGRTELRDLGETLEQAKATISPAEAERAASPAAAPAITQAAAAQPLDPYPVEPKGEPKRSKWFDRSRSR